VVLPKTSARRRRGGAGFILGLLVGLPLTHLLRAVHAAVTRPARALPGAEGPAAGETPGPRAETDINLSLPTDLFTAAQIRKLTLEIEALKRSSRWHFRSLPLLSAAIASLTLFFGLYQWHVQHEQNLAESVKERMSREAEQRIRLQNQIRDDLDQLLQFTRDERQTVSTASFLLTDLKALFGTRVGEDRSADDGFPGYKRDVTRTIVTKIKNDCQFDARPRDLGFAIAVFDNWPDYSAYLKQEDRASLDDLERVLYMHIAAMRHLRYGNPGYFEDLDYDAATDGYASSPAFDRQPNSERRYDHFLDIERGFTRHLRLLNENRSEAAKKVKDTVVREFERALCNPELSKVILGSDFTGEKICA
jgi:hypothetical protein